MCAKAHVLCRVPDHKPRSYNQSSINLRVNAKFSNGMTASQHIGSGRSPTKVDWLLNLLLFTNLLIRLG